MESTINRYFIDDNTTASVSLAYHGVKKHSKICNLLLGVSSVLLLSSGESIDVMSNNYDMQSINSNYIPNSICFAGSTSFIEECYFPKRKISAKLKKKYTLTDEELSKRINENSFASFNNGAEEFIGDFIEYNSGRFISSLNKWL